MFSPQAMQEYMRGQEEDEEEDSDDDDGDEGEDERVRRLKQLVSERRRTPQRTPPRVCIQHHSAWVFIVVDGLK